MASATGSRRHYDRDNRFFTEDFEEYSILVHEIVGKTVLGIGLGQQPRWS